MKLCAQLETILKMNISGDSRIIVLMEVKVLVCMRTYEHAYLRACNYLREMLHLSTRLVTNKGWTAALTSQAQTRGRC